MCISTLNLLRTTWAVILLVTTGACYDQYRVPVQELVKLNGFHEGQRIILNTTRDHSESQAIFTSSSRLTVVLPGEESVPQSYSEVSSKGMIWTGRTRKTHIRVTFDLNQAREVRIANFSYGKSITLMGGLLLGAGLIGGVTFAITKAIGNSLPSLGFTIPACCR